MKQPEYIEGPEALENSKRLATTILQAPAKEKKRQTKKSVSQAAEIRHGLERTGGPPSGRISRIIPIDSKNPISIPHSLE